MLGLQRRSSPRAQSSIAGSAGDPRDSLHPAQVGDSWCRAPDDDAIHGCGLSARKSPSTTSRRIASAELNQSICPRPGPAAATAARHKPRSPGPEMDGHTPQRGLPAGFAIHRPSGEHRNSSDALVARKAKACTVVPSNGRMARSQPVAGFSCANARYLLGCHDAAFAIWACRSTASHRRSVGVHVRSMRARRDRAKMMRRPSGVRWGIVVGGPNVSCVSVAYQLADPDVTLLAVRIKALLPSARAVGPVAFTFAAARRQCARAIGWSSGATAAPDITAVPSARVELHASGRSPRLEARALPADDFEPFHRTARRSRCPVISDPRTYRLSSCRAPLPSQGCRGWRGHIFGGPRAYRRSVSTAPATGVPVAMPRYRADSIQRRAPACQRQYAHQARAC